MKGLLDRTPKTHPQRRNVETALRNFKDIERHIWEEKNRERLRKQVGEIEKLFKPRISLMEPHRVFYYAADINVLEDRKTKE